MPILRVPSTAYKRARRPSLGTTSTVVFFFLRSPPYATTPNSGSSVTIVAAARSAPLNPRSISPEYHHDPRPISLLPSQARPQGRGSKPPPAPPSFSIPENQ